MKNSYWSKHSWANPSLNWTWHSSAPACCYILWQHKCVTHWLLHKLSQSISRAWSIVLFLESVQFVHSFLPFWPRTRVGYSPGSIEISQEILISLDSCYVWVLLHQKIFHVTRIIFLSKEDFFVLKFLQRGKQIPVRENRFVSQEIFLVRVLFHSCGKKWISSNRRLCTCMKKHTQIFIYRKMNSCDRK